MWRDLSLHASISRAIASPYFFQEEKEEEKRARSSKSPEQDVARNARKVEEKNQEENTVVSKVASLIPKGKPQGWKIPSSLTGVS